MVLAQKGFKKWAWYLSIILLMSACAEDEPADDEAIINSNVGIITFKNGASYNFGGVLNSKSSETSIFVKNSGPNKVIQLAGKYITAPFNYKGGSYPGTNGSCGAELAAGATCSLHLVYTPTDLNNHTSSLKINYFNGVDNKAAETTLLGKGALPATLESSVSPFDFTETVLLETTSTTLTITNSGEVSAESIAPGNLTLPFSFTGGTYPGTGGDCGETLTSGSNCVISLSFSPKTVDTFSDNLILSYNNGLVASNLDIPISGTSLPPLAPEVTGLLNQSDPSKSATWSWGCTGTCEYRYVINTEAIFTFTTENYGASNTATTDSVTGTYYIHVQARDTNYLTESLVATVIGVLDNTAPLLTGPVNISSDATETSSSTASWNAATEETAFDHYELAIGTTSKGTDVFNWTNITDTLTHKVLNLLLQSTSSYYTSIKAIDKAGNISTILSSSAWSPPGPSNAIINLSTSSIGITNIDLSWSAPNDNGTAITDYTIEFKLSSGSTWGVFNDGVSAATTASITGLTGSTSYDFRVIAYNGSSSGASNVITVITIIDDPFFDPAGYKAMNLGGAVTSQVVALDDATTFELFRSGALVETYTLNSHETHKFSSQQNDLLSADKPFFVAGKKGTSRFEDRLANITWNTPDWAGKTFLFTANIYGPHEVTIHAFEDANVEIKQGATVVDSIILTPGVTHTFLIAADGAFEVSSTGFIISYVISTNSGNRNYNPRPLLPASHDIIGFPSQSAFLSSVNSSNSFTATHSNDMIESSTLISGTDYEVLAQGSPTKFQCEAVRVIASSNIVAFSQDDGDGFSATPFIPVNLMKTRYAINVSASYVAFTSVEPADVLITYADGSQSTLTLTRSGSDSKAPYFGRVTLQGEGTIYSSTTPFAAWYESNVDRSSATNDETVLFGAN